LGIEALSRGASLGGFCLRMTPLLCYNKREFESTGFEKQSHVYCLDVLRAVSSLSEVYSLVLMDPPYSSPYIDRTLEALSSSALLGRDTIVVVTHSARRPLKSGYSQLVLLRDYRHGDSVINLYREAGVK